MLQAANFTGYHLKRRTLKIFAHHKSNSFHFPTGVINLSLKYDHTIIGFYTLLFNLENQMLGFKLNYSCRRIFLEGKAVHIFHCGRLNPTMLLVAKLLHSWLCFFKGKLCFSFLQYRKKNQRNMLGWRLHYRSIITPWFPQIPLSCLHFRGYLYK